MTPERKRLIQEERLRLLRLIAMAVEGEQRGLAALYRGQLRALDLDG